MDNRWPPSWWRYSRRYPWFFLQAGPTYAEDRRFHIGIGPIDDDDSGESEELIGQGVYEVARQWGVQGLTPYILRFHTEHAIISETPTMWPLEQRSALHLAVLDTVLQRLA